MQRERWSHRYSCFRSQHLCDHCSKALRLSLSSISFFAWYAMAKRIIDVEQLTTTIVWGHPASLEALPPVLGPHPWCRQPRSTCTPHYFPRLIINNRTPWALELHIYWRLLVDAKLSRSKETCVLARGVLHGPLLCALEDFAPGSRSSALRLSYAVISLCSESFLYVSRLHWRFSTFINRHSLEVPFGLI